MSACPFCGSDKIRIETPFIELKRSGEYLPKKTFCCSAQKRNFNYVNKHFDERDPDAPKVEEISQI